MIRHVTPSTADKAVLLLLAGAGLVGLLVVRRYGLVHGLRTVNRALAIARLVRTVRPSAPRLARKRPARRVRPKAVAFSKPA